jgi:hypothetical protein
LSPWLSSKACDLGLDGLPQQRSRAIAGDQPGERREGGGLLGGVIVQIGHTADATDHMPSARSA